MVRIRRARVEDLDEVYEVEVECFRFPYPRGLLLYYFSLPNTAFYVAEDKGRVIGYCLGVLRREIIGHVVSLAVREVYRGRGIGRSLLRILEEDLKRRGALLLRLEVRVSNKPAIDLYLRHGFKVAYVKRYYYPDLEDAYVMYKVLDRERCLALLVEPPSG